jgi:transketolase
MPKKVSKKAKKTPLYSENQTIAKLEEKATELREIVVEMLLKAGSGHSAGSLGTADIFAALYFHTLNFDPQNPQDPNRDRFILSNGHICPIWYATFYKLGLVKKAELATLRRLGSRLQGHPHRWEVPGIENSGGPLGQGLSQAIGMAIAAKMDQKSYRVYCMTGDGELDEGQVWEAAMFAPSKNLNNLTWIIDRNNIQIDGYTENVMPLEKLREKLEAFNWFVIEIDGHNIEEIINACEMAKSVSQRPTVIIAHTIPGKGVDFMQYKFAWHGKPPNRKEAQEALKQLRTLEGRIKHVYE